MSDWNKARLSSLISDRTEESLYLEYKAAAALEKDDKRRDQITKGVSAFANSSGGTLIYGINETEHLPTGLDPIDRRIIRREWLEQMIQSIQPKIDGVIIHSVAIDEESSKGCYVVEIPQSTTAHMASDGRYYKRFNFMACPMQDYEVRDVMNRRGHPKIQASVFCNLYANRLEGKGFILVKIRNVGRVLARYTMAELRMPIRLDTDLAIEDAFLEEDEEGNFYQFKMAPSIAASPLFPGSEQTLRREVKQGRFRSIDGRVLTSARDLRIKVFADEMPALEARLDFGATTLGWVKINGD